MYIFAVHLLSSPARAETWATKSALEMVRRARELELHEEYARALTKFGEAIRFDPTCGEAYLGLGRLRERIGDFNEAEKVYTLAAALPDVLGTALLARAELHLKVGDSAKALRDLEQAAELAPRDRGLVRKLSQWYAMRRTWSAALNAWRRFAVQNPNDSEAALQIQALTLLANQTDPVIAGRNYPNWVRRSIADLAQ